MEKNEHKIHYAQYSHLETVPIVSQKSLCPLHVIQADAQSESELNVVSEHQSYSAEWISLIQYSCGKKTWYETEISCVVWKRGNCNTIITVTRGKPPTDVQLNIQSEVAISISNENKCVSAGVRISQISNYANGGGSHRQEGDKYNLHVFLTSGKTERLSTVLPCKLLTSEDMMQSDR